jgi:hypothetical protein
MQRPTRARRVAPAVRAWLVLAVLGLAGAAIPACSPYDPALPRTPFLCGDDEPRCPDGHVCVADRDGRPVCRATDAVPDAGAIPDAAPAAPRAR